MHDYLKKILERKRRYVYLLKEDQARLRLIEEAVHAAQAGAQVGEFKRCLSRQGLQVIAEIKRQSPSKGSLATILNPVALARRYEAAGAAAISVLTDSYGFKGTVDDLNVVAASVSLPVLRKDFIIDPAQIVEAIYNGAKAVLLIVAILGDQTRFFVELCQRLRIDALVEVHDDSELRIAVDAGADIIGINNRNLHTFEVDTNQSLRLRDAIPSGITTVAESGIHDVSVARNYQQAGFDAVLVGEALVTAADPQQFIQEVSYVSHTH